MFITQTLSKLAIAFQFENKSTRKWTVEAVVIIVDVDVTCTTTSTSPRLPWRVGWRWGTSLSRASCWPWRCWSARRTACRRWAAGRVPSSGRPAAGVRAWTVTCTDSYVTEGEVRVLANMYMHFCVNNWYTRVYMYVDDIYRYMYPEMYILWRFCCINSRKLLTILV